MENYYKQKERIRQEIKEAHEKYCFYNSARFDALYEQLESALNCGDVEFAIDIIADIETAKKNFNKSLPWWYRSRFTDLYKDDLPGFETMIKTYEKNIYEKKVF
jgi:spore coat polysaccharide biosynthesis protein SpsF (cytidylyltransferase family)